MYGCLQGQTISDVYVPISVHSDPTPANFLESPAKCNSTTMIFIMGVAARLDYFNNLINGYLHKPIF